MGVIYSINYEFTLLKTENPQVALHFRGGLGIPFFNPVEIGFHYMKKHAFDGGIGVALSSFDDPIFFYKAGYSYTHENGFVFKFSPMYTPFDGLYDNGMPWLGASIGIKF